MAEHTPTCSDNENKKDESKMTVSHLDVHGLPVVPGAPQWPEGDVTRDGVHQRAAQTPQLD